MRHKLSRVVDVASHFLVGGCQGSRHIMATQGGGDGRRGEGGEEREEGRRGEGGGNGYIN